MDRKDLTVANSRAASSSASMVTAQPTRSQSSTPLSPNRLETSFTRGRFVPASDLENLDTWGFVLLYNAGQTVSDTINLTTKIEKGPKFDPNTCNCLCILEIPSYISPSDLLSFIGADGRDIISHIRLLRTEAPNAYMALLKFRDASLAHQWQLEISGASFSSLRPETCQVRAVHSVTSQSIDSDKSPTSFPSVSGDPFMPRCEEKRTKQVTLPGSTVQISSSSSLKVAALPESAPCVSNAELIADGPTCPVCLDRMDDEAVGVVTILCQHTFHSACLEKWRGNTCPVCRYTQNQSIDLKARLGDLSDHECSTCASSANLWICLICGNIGCGRYDSAHAFAHYEDTSHTFAMDISTQTVWDYVGDGYVHRLIHNKEVEDESHASTPGSSFSPQSNLTALGADMVPREKVDAMSSEYTYLLSSQLYTQRLFYEDQARATREIADKRESKLDEMIAIIGRLERELAQMKVSVSKSEDSHKASIRKTEKACKRIEEADLRTRQAEKQLSEEKLLNKLLLEKVQFLKAKAEDGTNERGRLQNKVQDLQEEVQDLNFFISTQDRVSKMTEADQDEINQGSLVVDTPAREKKKKKKPKKKGIPADVLATLQANVESNSQLQENNKG